MGTFIIGIAVLSLCVWVFQKIWKYILRWCFYLIEKLLDIVSYIITFVRRGVKAVAYLYRRTSSGKYIKQEVPLEEEVDIDILPEGLRNELKSHQEVLVRRDPIKPEEF